MPGCHSAPSPTPNVLPSNWLSASITRASRTGSSPKALAVGAAVSWARSSGDETRWVMSRPPNQAAARSAIRSPSSDRW